MTRAGRTPATSLGALVPELSAAWIERAPDRTHQRLPGTLVSADLSGFTALSERLAGGGRVGAEQLTEMVNRCFARLIDEAAASGGDVLKFGGDALLIWFEGEDHEVRAVGASARMQAALTEPALRSARLRMSVGMASGLLDVFLVGRSPRELVVAGPLATRVVRLEATAEAGQVLIDASTAAAVDGALLDDGPDGTRLVRLRAAQRLAPSTPLPNRSPHAGVADLVPSTVQAELGAAELLGGEHRLASVAFLSLGPLDDKVERSPADVAARLEVLLADLAATTDRYGATFLSTDVLADGLKLIVTTGVPSSTGDDEESLLRCARELVDRDTLGLRAGVNTGPVFAGFLGSPTRRTYTVMGDAVNLAARLLGKAFPGAVVASSDILERSRAIFTTRPIEPFMVKGKSQPVHARLVESLARTQELPAAASLPLVGRDREVRVLEHLTASAVSGEGRVVELAGPAGIGKTRLAFTLMDDPRLPTRLVAECQPYDAQVAYAGVAAMIRTVTGIPLGADPLSAGSTLTRFVERVAPDQVPWLPLLAAVAGADVKPTPEVDETAVIHRRGRLHEAVIALLRAALPMPSLLLVEDLAFVDDASRQLLRAIADVVPEHPWLLCVTRRSDVEPLAADDERVVSLELAPLDEAGCRALAGLASSSEAASDATLAAVADRSGGNPLFVIELVRAAGLTDELPDSIERVVTARIDALHPDDRLLLRHAAALGRAFDLDLLDRLSSEVGVGGAGDPARWSAMSELVQATGPRRFSFRHAMFRDVAYAALPFGHRQSLHARIGDLLLSEFADGAEVPAAVLSTHFALGNRPEEAWDWSVVAGRAASEQGAVIEAIECLERAIGAAPQVADLEPAAVAKVAEDLSDLRERAGRHEDAIAALRLAQRPDNPPVQAARLLRKHGQLRERVSRYSDALRWYTRALRALPDVDTDPEQTRERAAIELEYAAVRSRQGRYRESARWSAQAAEHARSVGAEECISRAAYLRIGVTGDRELEARLFAEAIEIGERLQDLDSLAALHNNMGIVAHDEGRWEQAKDHYEQAHAYSNRSGYVSRAATSAYNHGILLLDQGRIDEADDRCQEAGRVWSAARYAVGIALASSARARIAARRGDHYRALVLSDDALDLLRSMGAGALIGEALADRAECVLMAGQSREALDAIDEARALGDDVAVEPAVLARLERMAGFAHLQLGNLARAEEELRRSLATAEAEDARFESALTLLALARLAAYSGNPHTEAFTAEADYLLRQLGVTDLPLIPLPD